MQTDMNEIYKEVRRYGEILTDTGYADGVDEYRVLRIRSVDGNNWFFQLRKGEVILMKAQRMS